jgi:hypothetical protein
VAYDQFLCRQSRVKLDTFFNKTNASAYNIYGKCYNTTANSINAVNLGCEDYVGITNYLNDPVWKKNWNIKSTKKWEPCNEAIWLDYDSLNSTFTLLNGLVRDHLRIVLIR